MKPGIEVVASDGTHMKLVDAVAAGVAFFRFRIVEGPHEGKEIWLEQSYDGEPGVYTGEAMHSDGFGFGCGHQMCTPDCDAPCGGDVVPELKGIAVPGCDLYEEDDVPRGCVACGDQGCSLCSGGRI